MKRLTSILLAAVLTVIGASAVEATPDAPDRSESVSAPSGTISSQQSWSICHMKAQERANQGMAGAGGTVYHWDRSFHYGTAHITQCQLAVASPIGQGTYLECWQYTWNVSSPTWSRWKAGYYPTVSPCW